jgi:putative membrane protein
MRADKFFTGDEQERIRQAVIAAESKTSGEIVPMLVTSSARYTEVELLGLIAGLFAGMLAEFFWGDPWGSHYFNLWPVLGALVGFLICRVSTVKRLLSSQHRIADAVHVLALASFTEHGLHYTKDHTGILLFVSLLEHRVEMLADRGINEKVEPGTWDEVVAMIKMGLRSGAACDSFCNAIEHCGAILATHFPRQPDDKDELSNRLITK